MLILGINAFHGGASACLIRDGELVAAAEEERFRRIKYWAGFPSEAIRFCLAEAGVSAYELDHVGISRDPSAKLLNKALFALARRPSLSLVRDRLSNAARVRDPKAALVEALELDASSLRAQFHNVEHHRAHMASAFFVSPFREAAILSVDGMGDFSSTMWGVGRDTTIELFDSVTFPHSLGIFYTAVCQWLGFPRYGDEGKVMGLAPYGRPRFLEQMRRIVRLQRDGSFELDLDFFVHHAEGAAMTWDEGEPTLGTLFSQRLVQLLGPPRQPRSAVTERHQDVAASLQAMLEEAEMALVQMLQRKSGQQALCMAGGVALNSAFNGKILPNTAFDEIYIQAAAGDAGTALGVCFYIEHQILGRPRRTVLQHAYTGPQFDSASVAAALHAAGLHADGLSEEALCKRVAELMTEGKVVGWFQGRMEWGPRALGNRSIVADPRRADMKDILNARIKHREPFRPFAPSILLEATGDYFDQSYPDPFMLKVYGVRPEQQAKLPAVTHVDGTGRLQTVERATNPRYWALIKAFEGLTGVPVILNTSFNENEPIVCTPREAIDCFQRTHMDALAIGDFLVEK
jgi:carbamoyltransferase